MKKIRWGILSTAKIGVNKVIPAMQISEFGEVKAIASRKLEKAQVTAHLLNIKTAYGSYEELLQDPEIDAVYISLPNNLHVLWTIKALEAGKHVLCEKPIALNSSEMNQLITATEKYPHLKVMEAFMYRFHPQWLHAKKLVDEGIIGQVRTIQAFFSYYNDDPGNIRNRKEVGGGGLYDIGCYCISQSRFILDKEPLRVQGIAEYDADMGTDNLTSGILDFGTATSLFTCSTLLVPYQNFKVFGTEGYIEIEVPVNIAPDQQARIWLEVNRKKEEIYLQPANQYTLQCDHFSKAILDDTPVPLPLKDAINNMKVIDGIRESADKNTWISMNPG